MSNSKTFLFVPFLSKPYLKSAFRSFKWGFLIFDLEFSKRFPYSEMELSA